MAELVMTAGKVAVQGAQQVLPGLVRAAAGAAVANWLAPRHDGPRIDALALQTATDGAPMARLWGRARLTGEVIWASRLAEHASDTGGGKGWPKRREYSYTVSFAVGLCEGEIAGIGRIWSTGEPVDLAGLNWRVHEGSETQMPDALIAAIEGPDAPAFRGTAYLVIEDWPVERSGQRLPHLSVEVFRKGRVDGLESQVRGINLIPASGEFAYATDTVMRRLGPGTEQAENQNNGRGLPDLVAALDDLERDLPNCRSVQLVVAWFGNDLRCGACEIRPGVESRDKQTRPVSWRVAGQDRETAWLVSWDEERPVYGGTPDDASIVAAIAELRARGFRVSLYPFILMDIAAGNGLPDPYAGSEQAAFPWRGRITCHPAPGVAGSVDRSAAADDQVAAFFGTATASDYAVADGAVTYAGPDEWGLRRFILHCASLTVAAGGVDGFLIGSELAALTRVRGAGDGYPAVAHLQALAGEARSLLGPGVRLSYAADWSEYSGHQPGGGAHIFHLDPLWADAHIDAVAIDWYGPLADWRDGAEHVDAVLARRPHDAAYLAGQIAGGEGYDWYYASPVDRDVQARTPITDAAHGEPWVWRYKDLVNWWSQPHHDRPGGVRNLSATAWQPQSKPIWLTELGSPAVDKGANQPNVFVDPKSAESRLPYYSDGRRDDLIQRRYLEAHLSHWDDAAGNPLSSVYGGPMIEPDWIHVWTWDARPWPDFPARTEIWSDGGNWRLGHWLNGRVGQVPVRDIVGELCAATGIERVDVTRLDDIVAGYVVDRPMSVRAALAPLAGLLGWRVDAQAEALVFRSAGQGPVSGWTGEWAAAVAGGDRGWSFAAPSDVPRDVGLTFLDDRSDYQPGQARALDGPGTLRVVDMHVPVVADGDLARRWCAARLEEMVCRADVVSGALPPSALAVETGDGVMVDGEVRVVSELDGGAPRTVVVQRDSGGAASLDGPDSRVGDPIRPPSQPWLEVVDCGLTGEAGRAGPWLAGLARPWPGGLDVYVGEQRVAQLERAAAIGSLAGDLADGPVGYWQAGARAELDMDPAVALVSRPKAEVLGGANRLAVQRADGRWEILGYCEAELIGQGRWRIGDLLRGVHGSACGPVAAGASVVRLDEALVAWPVATAQIGENIRLSVVARGWPADHAQAGVVETVPLMRHLECLPPVHLRGQQTGAGWAFSWIRQSRIEADSWAAAEIPLGEAEERYRVEILDGGNVLVSAETGVAFHAHSGTLPTPFTLQVAQFSAATGWGRAARRVFAV
ncbi:baseplate multidomain protein megatron [Maricaulis sp. CAU 1757]